jgi:hypothetical protein
MSSNQLATFAVTDQSVSALKTLWTSPNLDIDKAIFFPYLRGTSPKVLPFFRRITPQTQPNFGATVIYQLDNAGDFLEELVLELQLSAIVQTPPVVGVGLTAYKNDATNAIQYIRLYQGGTLLQEHRQFELCFRNNCFQKYEKYVEKTIAENRLPFATRSANSGAPQTFYIEIPSLLDTLSVPLSILTSAIRIEITFVPVLNYIQYNGTNPQATILSANLRGRYVNADPDIMSALLEQGKKSSVLFPFYDSTQTQIDVAPNTNQIRFLLSEFKSLTSHMGWCLRESQQVDDTTGNPAFEISNTVGFTDWNLEDKGVFVVSNPDNLTPQFSKLIEQVQIFESYLDPATYNTVDFFSIPHAFSLEPQRDLHVDQILGTGYYDFSRTQSAYLDVNNPQSVNALRLTAFGWFQNVVIYRGGNLTKYVL